MVKHLKNSHYKQLVSQNVLEVLRKGLQEQEDAVKKLGKVDRQLYGHEHPIYRLRARENQPGLWKLKNYSIRNQKQFELVIAIKYARKGCFKPIGVEKKVPGSSIDKSMREVVVDAIEKTQEITVKKKSKKKFWVFGDNDQQLGAPVKGVIVSRDFLMWEKFDGEDYIT